MNGMRLLGGLIAHKNRKGPVVAGPVRIKKRCGLSDAGLLHLNKKGCKMFSNNNLDLSFRKRIQSHVDETTAKK
jgi:hypothetical protein